MSETTKSINDLEVDPHLDLSYASGHRDALRKVRALLKDRIEEINEEISDWLIKEHVDILEWEDLTDQEYDRWIEMGRKGKDAWITIVGFDKFNRILQLQSILGKGRNTKSIMRPARARYPEGRRTDKEPVPRG